MNRKGHCYLKWTISLSILLGLAALTALGQSSGGSFQIISHVVAGGGGGPSIGSGNLSVDGTVNGTSAGSPLNNPPFTLTGGFWPALLTLAPSCLPGDGSTVRVGSTVRCFFFAESTEMQFSNWSADGFSPKSSTMLDETFYTKGPSSASITVTWFDGVGERTKTFNFTIEHPHQ